MKFGGASVATPEQFSKISDIIISRLEDYKKIVVVISAMGNTTDQLLTLAKKVNENPPTRELDMLISVGERISISLLAMSLAAKGQEAISFTGSQSGIVTCGNHSEARIMAVKPTRLLPHLENGKIVIVAGFQGVSSGGEITTLGRGGSDTTAVALGVALRAEKVEFYKDVPGIFAEDPKINPLSTYFPSLSYEQALEIMQKGAKVLHPRSILLALRNRLPLHVISFYDPEKLASKGTIICSEHSASNALSQPIYEDL
jgi:aspartate kinase